MRPLTRSCFLLLPLWRLSFLPSLNSLEPALIHYEATLSSPCSRSDPRLSRQGAALAHLNSLPPYDLVLWPDGSVPFLFGKAALAYLPTALSVSLSLSKAMRPLFPFQQAQYAQVFLLLILAAQTSLQLLFSTYLTFALSSSLSLLLPQSLWQIWQELSSLLFCFIKLQWVPGHSFLP